MKKHTVNRSIFRIMCAAVALILIISSTPVSNAKNKKNEPKYRIKINKQCCTVTVYKKVKGKYKPKKAMICSPGPYTPLGTFSLGGKARWGTLMGPSYGQYCARITGRVLFHSVWYYSCGNKTSQCYREYNRLGTLASHGCVRLTVADAKYIYDKVPSGTPIIIYNSSKPGPLGRPMAIKVSGYCGWDPTDPDDNNPYKKKKPKIKGVKKNRNIKFGKKFKAMKGVTATNSTGFDATKLVEKTVYYRPYYLNRYIWVNKVYTKTPGQYKIKYSITDEIGHKAKKISYVKVLQKKGQTHHFPKNA
ncbi:MAG: L,D-transpeptidase family protein [Eubacterium sp.]|nr:L,D-transpeptidase family protein [Eubacterium sp.]